MVSEYLRNEMLNKNSPAQQRAPILTLEPSQIVAARAEYADIVVGSKVESRRWFLVAAVAVALDVALAGVLLVVLPLKEYVPYVVEVNKLTGESRAAQAATQSFEPGLNEKTYFLGRWARNMLEVDPNEQMTRQRLDEGIAMTRGKAVEQFREVVNRAAPIKRLRDDPSFSRRIAIRGINYVAQSNTATIQIRVEDRTVNNPAPTVRNFLVRSDFAVVKPTTQQEILNNPLGLFVIDFIVNEDAGQ